MLPFRPRLNHLRTDRLDQRLRQRLRDAGIPIPIPIPMPAATETETPPMGPLDMGTVAAMHPLLVSLHHVRWLLIHLRHMLFRQRIGMILGAGDNMFVWNRREPSIATGQMGEGDSVPDLELEVAMMMEPDDEA